MKVTVETLSPVLKKMSVEVPAETVDKALDRAYRAVGRKAKIRGFRPGKVPRRLLEVHYGHQVAHEVAEDLVRETYVEALGQEKIEPVAMPEVEDAGHVKAGAPWTYTAKVAVLPEIKVTAYEGLSAEAPETEVTTDAIDAEIDRIREAMAQIVPVEDRKKVQEGDFVVADVEATIEGKRLDDASGEGFTFEVVPGDLSEGNLPQAAGENVGATVELKQTFAADHANKKLAGQEVTFRATLKQLKKKELPEVDDELAKDLGEEGVDSLLALRGLIRERMGEQKQKESDRKVRDSLVDALVEKNPIDVPQILVDRTAQAMLRPVIEQMVRAGIDPAQLAEGQGPREMLAEVRPRAEKVVKGSLLLKAVADAEKLSVDEADVEHHYDEVAAETKVPVEKVKAAFAKDPDELESVKRRLLEDKALAFIRARASITGPGASGKPGAAPKVQKKKSAAEPAAEKATKKAAPEKKAAKKTTKKTTAKKAPAKKAPAKKTAAKKTAKKAATTKAASKKTAKKATKKKTK